MSQTCPGCGRRGVPALRAWLCPTCGVSHAAQVPNPAATVVVAMPLRELVGLDALASVALANRDAAAHLITEHRAAIS
jgi:hypothetical protein